MVIIEYILSSEITYLIIVYVYMDLYSPGSETNIQIKTPCTSEIFMSNKLYGKQVSIYFS